jgi:MOSC domain-containing protein YiiM
MAERCDECSFDGDRWPDQDVLTTLPIVAALWNEYIADATDDVLQTRAQAGEWSIAEYTDHVREVFFGMRFLLATALSEPDTDLGASPTPTFTAQPRTIDVERALDGLAQEGMTLALQLEGVGTAQWTAGVIVDGERVDLRWIGRHAVHDATHHLHDIGRIRQRLGEGAPQQIGTIEQVNTSKGSVPKSPLPEAEVDWDGVVGDRQNDRRHHGRPFQALSLWSGDVIDALVAEGHPVFAGAAGENLTVRGVHWAGLRPGAIVAIGDVVAEITSYATPCAKNASWFVDRDHTRMDHDLHPGWSRLYARVLRPGVVRVGDAFEVEPTSR